MNKAYAIIGLIKDIGVNAVRKMDFSDLNKDIFEKLPTVERSILRMKESQRNIRTRARDENEIKVLDQLCLKRWKKAEQEGKVKYLSERVWYYEVD
ncbi:hypothetical protein [Radiobacillus sp. PE A8.2]|uniref:hypothetical protein n=1 Tax=Radiobacillus sp. PE A8.2 TaxID=3380349 RepID=UPI00388EFD37